MAPTKTRPAPRADRFNARGRTFHGPDPRRAREHTSPARQHAVERSTYGEPDTDSFHKRHVILNPLVRWDAATKCSRMDYASGENRSARPLDAIADVGDSSKPLDRIFQGLAQRLRHSMTPGSNGRKRSFSDSNES
ncbi:hypothetical protein HPB51_012578 [Rhipicephalus microplus]|uniref:Uncharacterized protein n=1 Tax=Rhipicephalus microplus TaxID=6941 RepID=A0A9J6DGG0_RHIMP|nr:hypothetical protein HPB51_012578 [Rhipicephalus microplus]